MKKIIVATFLLTSIAGCAQTSVRLYDGAERSAGEVTTIRAWSPSQGNVAVLKIDGKEVQNGRVSHAYVLPGEHTLTVRFVNGTYKTEKSADLKVTAKAGHTYVVNAFPNFEKMKVHFEVEDKGTNYDPNCLIAKPFEPGGVQGNNC